MRNRDESMDEEAQAAAARLVRRLKDGYTITIAESCTGGLLASTLTDIAGASKWFNQSWVTYSYDAKIRELGVDTKTLEKRGAVSAEVAIQMAQGAKFQSDSNVSIGITGIAGPGGSTSNKEVGRVHVAVIAGDYFLSRRMDFGDNDRLDNKKSFAAFALRLTLEALDRVDENEAVVEEALNRDASEGSFDTSQLDPSSEEWEGSLEWQKSPRTVAEDIGKVDLASLTDWDSKE